MWLQVNRQHRLWYRRGLVVAVVILSLVSLTSVSYNWILHRREVKARLSLMNYQQTDEYVQALHKENLWLLLQVVASQDELAQQAAWQALENNTSQIAVWMAGRYGEAYQYQFQQLWRDQLRAQVEYAQAVRNQDNPRKIELVVSLSAAPEELTNFYLELRPGLDRSETQTLLETYFSWTKTLIDTSLAGDYTTYYRIQHESLVLMNTLASLITDRET